MESIFVLVVLVVMAASLPLVGAWWLADWSRGLLRNRRGQCAVCSSPLTDDADDLYMIQGRDACASCARQMKRQLPIQLTVLALAVGIAGALGITAAANLFAVDAGGWMITLAAMLGFGGSVLGAVKCMKWMNRRALTPRRDFEALLDSPLSDEHREDSALTTGAGSKWGLG
jgi:hypothetical protein